MTAGFDDYNPDTWVARVGIIDDDPFDQYLTSVYWAF
jgi:hypothetical protein